MPGIVAVPDGGFGYLPDGPFPFSVGVVALDGYALTRVRLRRQLPMTEGLAYAAAFLAARNRPPSSFAACELRSPAPLSFSDFGAFNERYASLLRAHQLGAEDAFPVARSNMAPLFNPPDTTRLFAFTYARPNETDSPTGDFLISGKPETSDTPPNIVAAGDVSPAGMAAKAHHVIAQLRRSVDDLGCRWADITGAQAYTVHPLEPVMDELRSSGLASVGLSLFPAYPPVVGLDFEIDVRSISLEQAVR